jgi:hypothetical protein
MPCLWTRPTCFYFLGLWEYYPGSTKFFSLSRCLFSDGDAGEDGGVSFECIGFVMRGDDLM